MYASIGMPNAPQEIEIPREFLDPAWEFDRDRRCDGGAGRAQHSGSGAWVSCRPCAMPLRLDGKRVGGLVFLSRTRAAFTEGDVLVARRLADRLAATLARDTTIEAIQARRRGHRAGLAARSARAGADRRSWTRAPGYRRVIGESAPWRQVLTQATQVAATETTVLLLGESGTGKEVDRPVPASRVATQQRAVRRLELRGAARSAARGRVVRLRARRVHRRARRASPGSSSRPRAARCSWTKSAR